MASKRAEFVFNAVREAVNDAPEHFKFLHEYENHWEKWFQIELATSLKRNGARDIEFEYSDCRFDLHKKKYVMANSA